MKNYVQNFDEFIKKVLNEGHSSDMGPSDYQNKDKTIKAIQDRIKDHKQYGGDLSGFRGVKFIGTVSSEDRLDRMASKYEDDYVIVAMLDGEVWEAYWRRS